MNVLKFLSSQNFLKISVLTNVGFDRVGSILTEKGHLKGTVSMAEYNFKGLHIKLVLAVSIDE